MPQFRPVRKRSLKELVAEQLRMEILAGRFSSGRLPTVRTLAERFGVSTMTIHGAQQELENEGLVETRPTKGVFLREEILRQRRRTAASRSLHIALFSRVRRAQAIKESYYSEVWAGLFTAAADMGHTVTTVYLPGSKEMEVVARTLAEMPFNGGILLGVPFRDVTERVVASGLPVVVADHHFPDLAVDAVDLDSESGSRTAVLHLAGMGHRRIGFMNNRHPDHNPDRLRGYIVGMAEAGLEVDEHWILQGAANEEGGYLLALQLARSRDDPPTAFVTHGGTMAVGAVVGFRSEGLRVPGDISVVGCGSRWFAEMYPWVTSVVADAYALGAESVRRLAERVENPDAPPRTLLLPMELVEGQTAAPPG
jgi:LacI family transcriptional regulator